VSEEVTAGNGTRHPMKTNRLAQPLAMTPHVILAEAGGGLTDSWCRASPAYHTCPQYGCAKSTTGYDAVRGDTADHSAPDVHAFGTAINGIKIRSLAVIAENCS